MKRFVFIVSFCALSAAISAQTTNTPAFLTLTNAEKIALKYHPDIAQSLRPAQPGFRM
jgi:hypothetical protein